MIANENHVSKWVTQQIVNFNVLYVFQKWSTFFETFYDVWTSNIPIMRTNFN